MCINTKYRTDLEALNDLKGTKSSSTRKYICPSCDMSVRATKAVNIQCNDCDCLMVED